MEITCRPVAAEHLEGEVGLRALREAIATELSNERGGPLFVAEAVRTTIETMLGAVAAGQAHLLGAFSADALIGWAYVRLHTLPDSRLLGSIDELAVHPDGRQLGAGELLLEHILAWCRAKGCIGVDSYALPGARETKNFFETFGMKARLLTVYVPLLDPPQPLRHGAASEAPQSTLSLTATPAETPLP
jgi:GNAT superfamily N-acetyltransferase